MATTKEMLAESQQAIADFYNLSKYLLSEDAPLDVNQIPPENPFYTTAREISDEMKLDWEKMSHEDSNRVMLNLMAEYFVRTQINEEYVPVLTVTFKKKD